MTTANEKICVSKMNKRINIIRILRLLPKSYDT